MVLVVRKSKTINFSERVLQVPVARCCDPGLYVVHWVEQHFSELPAEDEREAFRLPDDAGGSMPTMYGVYQQTLKWFTAKAGFEAEHVLPHSLRMGCCTYLVMCGATIEQIKTMGDWASETVYTYLQTPLAVRLRDDMKVAASLSADSG